MPHLYCNTLRLYTQQRFSQLNLKWNGKWGWHVLITFAGHLQQLMWLYCLGHAEFKANTPQTGGHAKQPSQMVRALEEFMWWRLWLHVWSGMAVTSLGIPVKRIYDCFHSVCESRHWGVATCWLPLKLYPDFIHFCWWLMNWCLMSSDVSWHIRDKLWPMLKHGSIILYVHRNQKAC